MIARFIEQRYFLREQAERDYYLHLQARSLERSDWLLLAYALMSNHLHLVVLAGRRSLASWLRPVHSTFADLLNARHERIGPIFVRGPKVYAVEPPRVAHLLAYVHNNPVRAGVVAAADESTWTSHRAYVGVTAPPPALSIDTGLALAGLTRAQFAAMVDCPERRADRTFSERAHDLAEREAQRAMVPRVDQVVDAVVAATASVVDVPAARMRSTDRRPSTVLARAVAARCSAAWGVPEREIGRALNVSQQRVSVLRRQPLSRAVAALLESVRGAVATSIGRGRVRGDQVHGDAQADADAVRGADDQRGAR